MQHYQPILAEAVEEVSRARVGRRRGRRGHDDPGRAFARGGARDPLLLADGCVVEVQDPELGPIRQVGTAIRLHENPTRIGAPPATAGRAHRPS